MKLGSFNVRKRKYDNGWAKMRKIRKVILGLIFFYSLLGASLGFCTGTSDASAKESLPPPQEDKTFGLTCPPGMCRIPQGILMGLRDMALGIHFIDEKTGWIVGNFGLGLKTEDGGESWQRVTFPGAEEESFKDVFFVGEKGFPGPYL